MPDPVKLYKQLKEYEDADGTVQDLIPKYKSEQEFTTALGDRKFREKLHQYLSANELIPESVASYVQFEKDVMGGIVSKPQAAVKEPTQAKPKGATMPYSGEPLSDQGQKTKDLLNIESTEPILTEEPPKQDLPYEGPYSESYQKAKGVSEFDKEKAIAQQNTGKPLYDKSKKELETEYQDIIGMIENPETAYKESKYSLKTNKEYLQDLELKAAEYEDALVNLDNPDRYDVLDPNSVLKSNIESGLIPQDAYIQAKNVSKLNESALRNRYQEINEKIAKDVGIDGYDVIGTYEQLKTLEAEGRLTPEQQETKARIESNELIPKLAKFRDKLDRQTLAIEAAYPADKNLEKAAREYQISIDKIDKSGMLGPVAEIGRVMASTGVKVAESINAMENTLQNLSISLTGKMINFGALPSVKASTYNALVDAGNTVGAAKFLLGTEEKENLGYKSLGIKYMQPSNRQISPLAQIANKDGILYEIEDGQVTAVRDSEGYIIPEPSEKIISQAREIEKDPEKFNPSRVNSLGIRSLATATQGAQIISDMAPILAMGAVSGGTGVALGSFATMYGPLYEQGIKEFGSANKAALYATSLAAIMSVIEVKLGKLEQNFGNAIQGRINRDAITADLRDVAVRFTNGELTPTQFSTEGLKAFIGRTVSELPGELKEEGLQLLTEEVGQSLTGIKDFDISWQDLGETALLTSVATLPVGALTATIAGNQFKAGLRTAIDKPALLQKELDGLVAEGTITQDQADETEIFIQNIVDIGLEYQENGASKKTVQKIKDLNLDKAIEQKRADNAKTELVKTKAEKAVAAIDAKIKEIDATIGTKQEDTVTEEPIEPITNTDQPSPEQDETDGGGVTPTTVSPISEEPVVSDTPIEEVPNEVLNDVPNDGVSDGTSERAVDENSILLNNAIDNVKSKYKIKVDDFSIGKSGTMEAIGTSHPVNGITISPISAKAYLDKLIEQHPNLDKDKTLQFIYEEAIRHETQHLEDAYESKAGEFDTKQKWAARERKLTKESNQRVNDFIEQSLQETPKSEETNKPITAKAKNGSLYTRQSNGTWKSERGVVATSPKLVESLNEQVKDLVSGYSPRDSQKSSKAEEPKTQKTGETTDVEDVGNFTADISDAKNNSEDKVASIDTNIKKYGVTNDASKSLIKRALEKVDGLSVNNVFDLAEKIAKNDNKPIQIEHIAEAIHYEVGRTEAEKDAFNISLDDIKETMLSQNKEYYPANKERMEEIGITEKSYAERKNKLKKIKGDYESLPDEAKVLVKNFITSFYNNIVEDAKFSTDEYLELLGGIVRGKEIEDIAENLSNAITIIEDKEAIQLKELPKVESPLLNRNSTEEALKRFTSNELKNIPVFNKAKVEQMIADGVKKNKEVRLNTHFAELYNLPDKVKVIVLNKDNTVSFLDKNDKPIKGVSLSKNEFVDLALKMGNARHTSAYEISRLYHEAKADDSNPEFVKSVEDLISKTQSQPTKENSQKTGETTTKTKETKQGFTETKDLNRMYKEVKTKYGIKEGGKIIDTALRLVDTTKNTIVEIRSDGVVVKEEGKFLFKPFTKAEGNSKKTILGKPMDISDQFETPKASGGIKSSRESNIEALINPETGMAATIRKMDIGQKEKDTFLERIGLTKEAYNKLDAEGKQKIQNQWVKSKEFEELSNRRDTPTQESTKKEEKVETPKQETRETTTEPKSEPKSKEQELKDELNSVLNDDTDLQFSRTDAKKDSPLYVDKSSTVKHTLSPMLVNQIAEAEKEGNRTKLISLRVIKALLPTFRAAGITLKLHPDGDSMMAAQRQANDFGDAAKGFYNPKTKEIHLNLESLTTDTPIHEILHPIVGMAMKAKPDVVKNWVESIKSDPIMGKDLAEFIERNYGKEKPDIKEAELVVTYVGQRVAEILSADPKNQETRGQDPEPKKSLYKKLIQKVKDLLNDLGIGLYKKDIIGEIGNETSVSDLAYTIADIISRRGVIQFQPSQNGNMQKQVDAWHGTPHQLKGGKFSTEFIGTGEGNQSFGWGLYFTDLKSIAEKYAQSLSRRDVKKLYESGEDMSATAYDKLSDVDFLGFDNEWAAASAFYSKSKGDIIKDYDITEQEYDAINDAFLEGKRNLVKATLHKGKTPDQYNWLEWDKPLTQSQKDLIKQKLQEDKHWIVDNDRPLGDGTLGVDGQMVYQSLNTLFGSPKDASLFLLNSGIDGIKYPAESLARGTTSDNARGFNYVVFDENAITVEEQIQFSRDDNFKSWVEGSVNKLFDLRPDMEGNKEYVNSRIEGIYEWLKEKGKDLSKADKSLISARMKEKFGIVDEKVKEAQTKSKATFNNQKAERVASDLNIPLDNKYVKDTLKGAIQTAMDADLDPNVILDNVNQGKTSLSKDEYLTLVTLWSDTKLSLGALEQRVQLGLATPQDLRLMEEFLNKMEEINNALVSARSTAGFILGTGSHILPLPKARSAQEIADLYNKAAGMAATEETRKLTQQLAEKLAKLEAEHKAEIENADAKAKEYEQKLNELSTRISTEEIKAKKINPSRVKNKKDLFEYVKTMSKSVILKSKEDGDTDSKADPDKVRREVLLGAVKVAIESGTDHKDLTAITDAVNGLIEELNAELAKSEETRDQKINPTDTQEIIATLLPVKKANIDNAKTKVNKAINELRTEAKRLNVLENLLNGIYKPQTGTKPNATQIKDIIDKIRLAAYKAETSESAKAEINELLSKVDANVIDWVNTGSMDAISRAIEAVRSISARKGKGKMSEADKDSAIAKDTKKWEDYKVAIDTYAKDPDKGASDILDLVATMDILPKKRESEYSKKLQARQTKLRKLRENLRRVAEAAHKKVNSSWIEKAGAKADDVIFNFFRSLKVTGDISAIFTNAYLGNMKLLFEAFAERDMAKAKVIQKAFVDAWGAFKAGLSNREDVALAHYEALQGMNGDIYEHLYGLKLSHPFDPELSEEYFKSNFAAKMGQQMGKAKFNIIQASEAHMTTYLNTIRYSLFNTFYEANPTASKEELQNFAEIVNLLTGTTNKPVNGLMTRLFLAPKYMISRWKVLASTFYDPKDTTHAIQQAVGTALALPLLIAAGAALLSGDDEPLISFDFDYLSQHFMKLKIGDNYIQSVPALTNIVQLVLQTLLVIMHANEADLTDLEKSNAYLKGGKGSYSLTYPAWQYLNQRFNPAVGVFTTLATKRDFKGDVYAPGWEGKADMAIDVFAPISVGSFFENMVNPKDDPNYIERMQPLLEAMGVPIVNYQNAAMHKDAQKIFTEADWSVGSKTRTPESSWTYPHEYFKDAYKNELKHRVGLAVLALKNKDPERTFSYKQLDKILADVKSNRVDYALPEDRKMSIDKYLREKFVREYGEERLNEFVGGAKKKKESAEAKKKEKRSQ